MADLLNLHKAADELGISEPTARRYVKSGKLPALFVGGRYRVRREDIEEFLRRSEVRPSDLPKEPAPSRRRVPVDISAAAGAAAGAAAELTIGEHFRAIVVKLRRAGRDEEAERVERLAEDLEAA